MLKSWISISLICIVGLSNLSAQKLKLPSGSQIAFEYQQGRTLRHRETMVFALPNPARAYSLDVAREMDGSRAWHRRYGYPRVGFSAWLQDFGNPEVLGRSWSLHPFIDFNVWTLKDFRLRFRLAYGLAWIDRIHHPDNNAINNAIGSHINNVTSLGLLAEYWIAQRLIVRGGATLSHNSNGRLSVPNLGLNTTKLRVGIGYMLRPPERIKTQREAEVNLPKRLIVTARFGLAFKEDKTAFGPKYPVYILAVGAARWLGPKSRVFAGYEFSHDQTNAAFNRNQEIEEGVFRPNRHLGFLGHEFIIGHVGIMTQYFAYLDPPFAGGDSWGFKIGPHWYFRQPVEHPDQNVYFGVYLKAHKAVADFAELTLGFTF